MKTGDKLICIKNNNVNHTKNKIYDIIEVRESKAELYETYYIISNDLGQSIFYIDTLNKYFIPLKQQRKQKLEKLNEIQY